MKLLCLLTIVNVATGSLPEVDEVLTSADVQLLQATLSVETKPAVTTEDKVKQNTAAQANVSSETSDFIDHQQCLSHLNDSTISMHNSWQNKIVALLHDFDKHLSRDAVPYWIVGGTLLGAFRHQGFIPHDNDADVEMKASDLPQAVAALTAVGWTYCEKGHWAGVRQGRFDYKHGSLDVFLRDEDFRDADPSTHPEGYQYYPSQDEVYPLQHVNFNGLRLPAPRAAVSFLHRCYPSWDSRVAVFGHDWGKTCYINLSAYTASMKSLGYQAPVAAATSANSLFAAGLLEQDEARTPSEKAGNNYAMCEASSRLSSSSRSRRRGEHLGRRRKYNGYTRGSSSSSYYLGR